MADGEIKLFDSSSKETGPNQPRICFFCCKNASKYTCPRCNVEYCSLSCYQSEKHVNCSEGFYKQSVLQELSQRANDDEDAQNVLRMLKRVEEEGEAETDGCPEVCSLEERLENIDLDDADPNRVWESLTAEEKLDFETSVKLGYLSNMIEEWNPWWKQHNSQTKVNMQVLDEEHNKSDPTKRTEDGSRQEPIYPGVLKKIPLMTTKPANLLIKYSIVDVLFAYAYTMRLYNGAPFENPEDSALTLYTLSSSLSKNMTFESLEEVVHSSLSIVLENKEMFNSLEFSYNILSDVADLTVGNCTKQGNVVSFIDCALSESRQILEKGRKYLKDGTGRNNSDVKKLWLAKKKVEFFLSWTQSNCHVVCCFAPLLVTMYADLIAHCESHEATKKILQEKWKGVKPPIPRKLIEEM